ncbi:hypothetical protein [Sporisorium scitamineum]|uniref:Uncharacterized protein n=1 Tax=Sporisorium scitamineum TaxID=49012 RepID=A0A0F7S1I9_9BASI|nr:hypothetical protein [Sporisorium scitamineum]
MYILPNTVRICLPKGITRRPRDQLHLKKEICLQFDKAWPASELPIVNFPVSNTNKAVNRFMDISINGDVPRPVEVGLKLTSEWKVVQQSFDGPYLFGPCLPTNIIAIELCGVYAFD